LAVAAVVVAIAAGRRTLVVTLATMGALIATYGFVVRGGSCHSRRSNEGI